MYLELVSDRQRSRLRHVLVSWFATAATCGYLFPWAVAVTRGKAYRQGLGLMAVGDCCVAAAGVSALWRRLR